jgi:ADP-ribose pyrophosphatase
VRRTHEVVDSTSPYEGGFFRVVVDQIRLPGGRVVRREIVRHTGAAAVVPLRGGEVLLVRQNRHAVGDDLLEVPAGKLDVAGEAPEDCAHRELEEETGFRAGALEKLGMFYSSPGFTDEAFHLYLATDLSEVGAAPTHDDGEPIASEWLALDDALAAIADGRIVDAKTALGLALVRLRLPVGGTLGSAG